MCKKIPFYKIPQISQELKRNSCVLSSLLELDNKTYYSNFDSRHCSNLH